MTTQFSFPTLIAVSFAVAACTELKVTAVNSDSRTPVQGIEYSLPFVQFDLSITRAVTECSPFTISYTADVKPIMAQDPDQHYAVDYTSLASWTKISSFKATKYENGMLKEFNAAAEDRTGQVAAALATTIGTIAVKVATAGVEAAQPAIECNSETKLALDDTKEKKTVLRSATQELVAATAHFSQLLLAAGAIGGGMSPEYQKLVVSAAQAIQTAQDKVDNAAKSLSRALKLVSHTQAIRWPTSGSTDTIYVDGALAYQQTIIPGNPDAIVKWTGHKPDPDYFRTALQLRPSSEVVATTPVLPVVNPSGIRYRSPVRGKLLLCLLPLQSQGGETFPPHETSDATSCINDSGSRVISAAQEALWEGPVPQFGQLHFLPYENGVFQNNVLSATFTEDGNLATVAYEDKSSRLESAVTTAQSVAATTTSTLTTISTGKTVRLKAQIDEVKAESDLAKALAERKAYEIALDPAIDDAKQKAMLHSDTDLLNAQIAKINAQIALQKAQSAIAGLP